MLKRSIFLFSGILKVKLYPCAWSDSGTHNDTVHEMAKDEARHGKAFLGLLQRYFG